MKFKGKKFRNDNILLDGNEFKNCTFDNCNLEYCGFTGISLDGCSFNDCVWSFGKPASNAIQFMASLYAIGGDAKQLIESTFDNIRAGIIPPTKH